MKRTELKRRLTLAVKALKGAPLIYDYPVPRLKVEAQPVETIQARFELSQPEADMVPPEVATKIAERKLLENLMAGLYQSGLVKVTKRNTSLAIVYEARIRAIAPAEEDDHE